ncbi:MAG: hypothetical protein Q8L71_11415 [Thiobacillus sp.]|nr:hypothetical protein [Thiobacillus sp.]
MDTSSLLNIGLQLGCKRRIHSPWLHGNHAAQACQCGSRFFTKPYRQAPCRASTQADDAPIEPMPTKRESWAVTQGDDAPAEAKNKAAEFSINVLRLASLWRALARLPVY